MIFMPKQKLVAINSNFKIFFVNQNLLVNQKWAQLGIQFFANFMIINLKPIF